MSDRVLAFASKVSDAMLQPTDVDTVFRLFHPGVPWKWTKASGKLDQLVRIILEIGIVAVTNGGGVVWRLATDVISKLRLADASLHLEFMDDAPVTIDVVSGKRRAQ